MKPAQRQDNLSNPMDVAIALPQESPQDSRQDYQHEWQSSLEPTVAPHAQRVSGRINTALETTSQPMGLFLTINPEPHGKQGQSSLLNNHIFEPLKTRKSSQQILIPYDLIETTIASSFKPREVNNNSMD